MCDNSSVSNLKLNSSINKSKNNTTSSTTNTELDDWGSYFSAKKAKLALQLNPQSPQLLNSFPQIFSGIVIYINGYTNPPEPELRQIFSNHGGHYSQHLSSSTTFIIAQNLPNAKKKLMAGKTLKPEWITESVKAGVKLDHRKFFLYNSTEEMGQHTLTQIINKSNSSPLKSTSETQEDEIEGIDCDDNGGGGMLLNKIPEIKSTSDESFLEDFYNKSRLHLISTMKKETQQLVAGWRRNLSNHKFDLLSQYLLKSRNEISEEESNLDQCIIFHIDIDCFFVAVGRLSRPNLNNVPVAVTHSKGSGPTSKSDIACVSYEGRRKGVTAGMWLDEAKKLCPELQTIPYEFQEYKRVSKLFFEAVGRLTLEIEPISCDELYINPTKILSQSGSSPIHLAQFLKDAIKDIAQVNVSIGIGNSKLSSRIGTRIAKENSEGIRLMTPPALKEYIKKLPVKQLPGVGYSINQKLNEIHKIKTCEELQFLSIEELKSTFGVKTGEKLYLLSRGIDNELINCDSIQHQPKSVSAGCSFGVRFGNNDEMNLFTKQLCNEVCKRALELECTVNKLTLSLWIVKKGYENKETLKPGGHGIVDIHSRTRNFHINTRDSDIIFKMCSELNRSITSNSIPPSHIRGLRISLENLRYENNIHQNEKKSIQSTIQSTFFGQTRNKHQQNTFNEYQIPTQILENDNENIHSAADKEYNENDTLELPFLNGVNTILNIKKLLRGAINLKIKPNEKDVSMLENYISELLVLDKSEEILSDFLNHIFKLGVELNENGGELEGIWAFVFFKTIQNSKNLILDKLNGKMD